MKTTDRHALDLGGAALGRGLALGAAALVAAGVGAEIAKEALALPSGHPAVAFFSLSYEGNLPTWYASALLLACACLLAAIAADAARKAEPFLRRWRLLAAGFAFMSLDEAAELHERAGALFEGRGALHFGWVVPAAALVLGLAAPYAPFLLHLPPRPRRAFAVAGALYVLGAVGMELPLGWWTERHGADNLGYALLDAVEEALELAGASLFARALLDELGRRGVSLAAAPPDDGGTA